MDRSIIAPLEQMRDFDFVQFEHDVLCALGDLAKDCLSQLATTATSQTTLGGFAATQSTPTASLNVVLGPGRVYTLTAADASADGSLTLDATIICQQGRNAGQTLTLSAPSAGQSQWNLIQCQFSQTDAVRANDPNSGIVPFFNAANPAQPSNTSVNTVRLGNAVIQVITGSAATTGAEVPPQPTSGWVPLYLIDLAGGQTQITTPQILVTGPSVGTGVPSNYPAAPFLAGFQASHHNGNPGQAPKVQLTNAAEVQGILPYLNMSPVRTLLSGGLILTVNTSTGSDNNPGTVSLPFKTIQAAVNSVYRNYDFNGNTCTINVVNGTYSVTGSGVVGVSCVGVPVGLNAPINIIGNIASPGSVTLAVAGGNGFGFSAGCIANLQGFTITASGSNQGITTAQGYGLSVGSAARVTISNIVMGNCGTASLDANTGGVLIANGPVTFTGTTGAAILAELNGAVWTIGQTFTVTGLTMTEFVLADTCGVVDCSSMTFVGSPTGAKYLITSNAVVNTGGQAITYLPGSTSGGTATGGQYV